MDERAVTHSTFVIERTYPSTPEQVFAAFADPAKKSKWFASDEGSAIEEYEMDFRIGGKEHRRGLISSGPYKGTPLTNHTVYQDIVPNQRIVLAYTMTIGDNRMSASLATFEFMPNDQGTNLIFTDQGAYFAGADGPEMRKEGWTHMLARLAKKLER